MIAGTLVRGIQCCRAQSERQWHRPHHSTVYSAIIDKTLIPRKTVGFLNMLMAMALWRTGIKY